MKKTVGIRDIARMAGVSVATVSRVINAPEKTSETVRKRVLAVIQENNYVPNINATHLFAGTSNAFALFIYDMENPYFTLLIKEMGQIALRNKCSLLICNTENDPVLEAEYLHYCERINTNGIILTEGFSNNVKTFEKTAQRLIGLDRRIDGSHPCISSDNKKGMHLLMDYLYNLNHRIFGFAGYIPQFQSSQSRFDGFVEAIEERGQEFSREYLFEGSLEVKTGIKAMDYFCSLRNKPTAIVCANDLTALGVCMRATQLGFHIPRDFSVVGFDGCMPEYAYPKLTTIRQNISLLSQMLFDSLFHSDGIEIDSQLAKQSDVSLVIGDTCRKI